MLAVDEVWLREPRLLVPRQQPVGNVKIDRSNSIGKKCLGALVGRNCVAGSQFLFDEFVSGTVFTAENNYQAWKFDGVNDAILTHGGTLMGRTTNFTVFGLVWFSGSASDNGRWFDLGYATGCGLGTGGTSFDNAGTNFIGLLDSVAWITTSTTVPTGLNSFCWRTTAANSHSMWLNGKQEATSTSTIQAIAEAVPGSGTTLSLGGTWLTGRFSGCSLPLFYVIDGVLSDVDIKALHADPYQLVIPV